MALTSSDFQRPAGRLDPTWFTDADATLTPLITQAQELTDDEKAQAAWVYARAYALLADDAMRQAAERAADDIRERHSDAQLRHWQRMSDAAQAEYRSIVGATPPGSGVSSVTPTW